VSRRHDDIAVRFRDGDEDALAEAYARYGAAIHHLARTSLGHDADAEDLVSTVFVAAWRQRERYLPAMESLLGWLLGLARRKVVERLLTRPRDERPRAVATERDPATDQTEPLAPPDLIVERLVVAAEMAAMPDEQRRVLELAFYDGLTHRQITALTGLAPDIVRNHMRQGLARLRERWEVDSASRAV